MAWSHCPLCELKQVACFPPTAQSTLPPCAGALGHPPHYCHLQPWLCTRNSPPTPLAFHTTPSLHRYAHGRGIGGGGREEERLLCSPPAPQHPLVASLSSRRPFSHLLVSCQDLKGAGGPGLCPARATVGRKFPGFLLFLFPLLTLKFLFCFCRLTRTRGYFLVILSWHCHLAVPGVQHLDQIGTWR